MRETWFPGTRRILAAVLGLALLAGVAGSGAAAAPAAQPGAAPVSAGLPTDPVPDPHDPKVQYFPQTQHTLRGTFLAYWQRYGGLAQFGYPITEEFAEQGGPTAHAPLVVQYFQRARFEHHPQNPAPSLQPAQGVETWEVQLGLLGTAFHAPDPPVGPQRNASAIYFPATGHNLSGVFKTYWQSHGGLFVNGYPITEQFEEKSPTDGQTYLVQYFERERYELHLGPTGQLDQVELGLLGTQMAQKLGYFGGGSGGSGNTMPRLGHAADFSWIAGQIVHTRIQGGCTFITYDTAGSHVVPMGYGWTNAQQAGLDKDGAYVVVYGHMAGPGEPVEMCAGAPGYVINTLQPNAGP